MSSRKIKAVVVDDSNFMVTIIKDILESHDAIEVVGTGMNGLDALNLNDRKNPDVILMDIEMPEMDGLTAVKRIMEENPTPVVIVSGKSDRSNKMAVKALEAGAVEFVAKTSGSLSMDIRKKSDEIINKTLNAAEIDLRYFKVDAKKKVGNKFKPQRYKNHLIVVASSTGGTRALDSFLSILPQNFPVPIIIVQHMPEEFTRYLASTLNSKLDITVKEAENKEAIETNHIYIIPSGLHGFIKSGNDKNRISLKKKPKLHGVRPSADYLFRSAAEIYQDRLIGIVFTGMGKDGAEGARIIKNNRGYIAVQDEKSSVVYGMPKMTKDKAGYDFEGTPEMIGEKIVEIFTEEQF